MRLSDAAKLRGRTFAGPEDFPAMRDCANASFAADGVEVFRTVDDMARDYAAFTSCVPTRDVWLAHVGDELAGYVRCWDWDQPDGQRFYGQVGFVAPRWRRQGVGAALQSWVEARHRAMAAEHPDAPRHWHQAFVHQGETARAALMEKAGYRPERYFFTMVRPTLEAIPDIPLPPGLEVRPVQPEHRRPIWDAHQRAFEAAWGYSVATEADYQAWLRSKVFQPQLWQVAWDVATGEVAGQVRGFVDREFNAVHPRRRGWTEFISVGARWRRRGLARALIVRSLRAQREAGMVESGLGVDSENQDGAYRVYADCGFEVVKRNCIYRKPLAPAGGG